MPPRYKPTEECRELIQEYIDELEAGTDDNDSEMRGSGSTKRYGQDLRWFDDWLDDEGIDEITAVGARESQKLGRELSNEFNGTTPRYRWDRIYAFYEWARAIEAVPENPLEKWDDRKGEKWGLTKTTEQERQLEEGESYAVSQEEVRKMEKNVGSPRLRNQTLVRMAWQTGCRRGELAELTIDMLNRDPREIKLPSRITKNDESRVVAYQPTLDGLVSQWLDVERPDYMTGKDHNRVFCGIRGGKMSGEAINEVVVKAACNAGINEPVGYENANGAEPWKITSHSLRKGFGTYMMHSDDSECGLWELSHLLGHSSVKITEEIYVKDDPRTGVPEAKKYGPD